jgi:hypothetical protein
MTFFIDLELLYSIIFIITNAMMFIIIIIIVYYSIDFNNETEFLLPSTT